MTAANPLPFRHVPTNRMRAMMKGEWATEMHNHHADSTISNDLFFRDDDFISATSAKSGTIWASRSSPSVCFRRRRLVFRPYPPGLI
jgi:hypothetical protein